MLQRTHHTYVGLDLAQRRDFTALVVVDHVEVISAMRDPVTFQFPSHAELHLRDAVRIPRGTPFTAIPGIVRKALAQMPAGFNGERPPATVALDATGMGLPVVDLLRAERLGVTLLPIIITGGQAPGSLSGGLHSVPRRDLLTLLRIALETRNLKFARDLRLREELTAELASVSLTGHKSSYDDMAFAIALALWAAAKRRPGLLHRPPPRVSSETPVGL